MKTTFTLIVAIACVTTANATMEFFFTHGVNDPWGMSGVDDFGDPVPGFDPLLHMSVPGPAPGGGYYYGDGFKLSDIGITGTTAAALADDVPTAADLAPIVTLAPGQWANIWIRFAPDETTGPDYKLTGIQEFTMSIGGSTAGVNMVGYQLRAIRRWQLNSDADYYLNPLNLFAGTTSPAIANVSSSDRTNLYIGLESTNYRRTALLGAVWCDPGTFGTLNASIANLFTYEYPVPHDLVFLNGVECVPEPSSMLLVLAVARVRRR